MRELIELDIVELRDMTLISTPWFEGYESLIGDTVLIKGEKYEIEDVNRNRCSGFFFGTDEEWDKRDVWLKVKSV